jgi:hypothetical protein
VKKALKWFISALISIAVAIAVITVAIGVVVGIAYAVSFLADIAMTEKIVEIVFYSIEALFFLLILIAGTSEIYQKIFKRKRT